MRILIRSKYGRSSSSNMDDHLSKSPRYINTSSDHHFFTTPLLPSNIHLHLLPTFKHLSKCSSPSSSLPSLPHWPWPHHISPSPSQASRLPSQPQPTPLAATSVELVLCSAETASRMLATDLFNLSSVDCRAWRASAPPLVLLAMLD